MINNWKDNFLIDFKYFFIFDILLSSVLLFFVYFCSTIFFIDLFDFKKQLFSIISVLIFGTWYVFCLLVIKYKCITIREIFLFNDRISGHCYYKKGFNIYFSEIKTISVYKNTFIRKNLALFHREKKGVLILLKNGKKYYISPYMNDLNNLKYFLLKNMH